MVAGVPVKYSDQLIDWLAEDGYTHCFFVAGGNIMHLLDSVRSRMTCVPFIHEVGATIGAEYFNAARDPEGGRAFVLVTAGPGVTNTLTGVAGAWQESRELLVIAGQVKKDDLANGEVRQRGIQEIDGLALVESISKASLRIEAPVPRGEVMALVHQGREPRMGPVFLEVCLDATAAPPLADDSVGALPAWLPDVDAVSAADVDQVRVWLAESTRPVVLVGGGASRASIRALVEETTAAGIPLMTTWNGADRVPTEHPMYAGRPDTWGQRSANVLIQQADLVIAVGARLGLQQTGFSWQQFASVGRVVQVEIDYAELKKGHPRVDLPLQGDADQFLIDLYRGSLPPSEQWADWRSFIADVRRELPLNDPANATAEGFVKPFELAMALCDIAGPDDVILPCSSGGAATVSMQSLRMRAGQKLVGDKSLASMGYGLAGSIGAALANPDRTVFLTEGDGGFAQNLQELGTLAATGASVKIFLMVNGGYASIRMTQRNYFGGAWIGCDESTGLGLPRWETLAASYGIRYARMEADDPFGGAVGEAIAAPGPALIEVPIDPEQTYFPKITSAVQPDGSMRSNPLHLMSPDLPEDVAARVFRFLSS
jgi:acetolactate synthase-1/2/3 large subunit